MPPTDYSKYQTPADYAENFTNVHRTLTDALGSATDNIADLEGDELFSAAEVKEEKELIAALQLLVTRFDDLAAYLPEEAMD